MRYLRFLLALVLLSLWLSGLQACAPDPDPCVTSDDCLLKGQVCRGNFCIQQSSCEKDDDCKYKEEVCRDNKCEINDGRLPPPKGCPGSCSSDGECKECKDGRSSCIRGICALKERAKKFEQCGNEVGKACEDNAICSGGGSNQYCLPECDPNKSKRCDSSSGCYDPTGKGAGLCLPDGQAKEGSPCSPNYQGKGKIDASQFCKEGLRCHNSKCITPVVVGSYKKCDSASTCDKAKATCVILSADGAFGYCLPLCTEMGKACDGGKGTCVKLPSGKGGCLPNGTASEDARCGPQGDELKGQHLCGSGLKCIGFSTTFAICLKTVAQCADGACAQGRTCLSGSTNGACVLPCSQDGKCPASFTCNPLQTPSGNLSLCSK